MMEGADPIADFMAMTGCASEDEAIEYLSVADFNLGSAVISYQADHSGGTRREETPIPAVVDVPDEEDDLAPYEHQFDRQLQEPTPPTSNASPTHIATLAGGGTFPSRPVDNPEREDSAFDNAVGPLSDRLRAMFAVPSYARRNEPFSSVCAAASRANQWLVVAIRDASFASSCIVRDVWNAESMQMIAQHFTFADYVTSTSAGQQCANAFSVTHGGVPCMFLVDPITHHREQTLPLEKDANGVIKASLVVNELLTFIASNGSPNQLYASLEGNEEVEVVDDDDAEEGVEEGEKGEEGTARTEASPEAEVSPTAAAASPPEPVSIEEWTLPAEDSTGLKFRVRLPKSSATLCLRPETPVRVLSEYLAYRVHEEDAETFAVAPAIEIRGGFPPKPLPLPEDSSAPLSAWPGVRSGDALTVHIK